MVVAGVRAEKFPFRFDALPHQGSVLLVRVLLVHKDQLSPLYFGLPTVEVIGTVHTDWPLKVHEPAGLWRIALRDALVVWRSREGRPLDHATQDDKLGFVFEARAA